MRRLVRPRLDDEQWAPLRAAHEAAVGLWEAPRRLGLAKSRSGPVYQMLADEAAVPAPRTHPGPCPR
jgi:hypothetical protein